MQTLLGCALAFISTCSGLAADDKKPDMIDAQKLVGRWQAKVGEKGVTAVMEFKSKGKTTHTVAFGNEELKVEGTYTVVGNNVTLAMEAKGKELTIRRTISKLTDTGLVSTDESGKKVEFFRVKGN